MERWTGTGRERCGVDKDGDGVERITSQPDKSEEPESDTRIAAVSARCPSIPHSTARRLCCSLTLQFWFSRPPFDWLVKIAFWWEEGRVQGVTESKQVHAWGQEGTAACWGASWKAHQELLRVMEDVSKTRSKLLRWTTVAQAGRGVPAVRCRGKMRHTQLGWWEWGGNLKSRMSSSWSQELPLATDFARFLCTVCSKVPPADSDCQPVDVNSKQVCSNVQVLGACVDDSHMVGKAEHCTWEVLEQFWNSEGQPVTRCAQRRLKMNTHGQNTAFCWSHARWRHKTSTCDWLQFQGCLQGCCWVQFQGRVWMRCLDCLGCSVGQSLVPLTFIMALLEECCWTCACHSSTAAGHWTLCHTPWCSKDQGLSIDCDLMNDDFWLMRSGLHKFDKIPCEKPCQMIKVSNLHGQGLSEFRNCLLSRANKMSKWIIVDKFSHECTCSGKLNMLSKNNFLQLWVKMMCQQLEGKTQLFNWLQMLHHVLHSWQTLMTTNAWPFLVSESVTSEDMFLMYLKWCWARIKQNMEMKKPCWSIGTVSVQFWATMFCNIHGVVQSKKSVQCIWNWSRKFGEILIIIWKSSSYQCSHKVHAWCSCQEWNGVILIAWLLLIEMIEVFKTRWWLKGEMSSNLWMCMQIGLEKSELKSTYYSCFAPVSLSEFLGIHIQTYHIQILR